jgi:tetratricopeptide (TPR) repeat protein
VTNYSDAINEMAKMHEAVKDYDKQLILLNQAVEFFKSVTYKFESNLYYKEKYAEALKNMGRYYDRSTNYASAVQYYGREKLVYDDMFALDGNNDYIIKKLRAINRIAASYRKSGKFKNEIESLNEEIEIFSKVCEDNPDNQDYQRRAAVLYDRIGNRFLSDKDYANALQGFLKEKEIFEGLLNKNPEEPEAKKEYANSLLNLGRVYSFNNNVKARKYFSDAFDIFKQLVKSSKDEAEYIDGYLEARELLKSL